MADPQDRRIQRSAPRRPHLSALPAFARARSSQTTASTPKPNAIRRRSGRGSPASSSGRTPWTTVLDWQPPHAKWFVGGTLNASVNCLDRHVRGPRRNKAAHHLGRRARRPPHAHLLRSLSRGLAVRQRPEVARRHARATASRIYLPLIPELAIAMLACARIGAVHSVVFGGFSAESLRDRINDAQARLLITADGGYRRGQIVAAQERSPTKRWSDTPSIEHVVVVQRRPARRFRCTMQEGRDHWYHELMQDAPLTCEPEPMDAEDMLYILYTSGTTGKPKGIVHTTGGYLVGTYATTKLVFDLKRGRRLLVHGGHRLGHRPQLRRLRSAGQRRDGPDVRGRARLAAERSLLVDRSNATASRSSTPRRPRSARSCAGAPIGPDGTTCRRCG